MQNIGPNFKEKGMRGSPILASVCWIGAAVMGVCAVSVKGGRREEARTETLLPVAGVETPAEKDVRMPVPEIPASVRIVRMNPTHNVERSAENKNSYVVCGMKVTAYCLCGVCCEKWASNGTRKTSIGDDARIYDGVAADPKLLPYRTRLEIPEIGIKEVDDTGGGMRQDAKRGIYHIDVRMPSHSAARQWGARWLNVKILN